MAGGTHCPAGAGFAPWAYAQAVTPNIATSANANTFHTVSFDGVTDTFATNDQTVFKIKSTGGYSGISIYAVGTYLVYFSCQLGATAAGAQAAFIQNMQQLGATHYDDIGPTGLAGAIGLSVNYLPVASPTLKRIDAWQAAIYYVTGGQASGGSTPLAIEVAHNMGVTATQQSVLFVQQIETQLITNLIV